MKGFPSLNAFPVIIIFLLTAACATDRPPSGGPVDNSPLKIVASDPENGSVNVSPEKIRLSFSHHITLRALLQSVFFSPLVSDYDISVHGKEAEINFFDSLRTNHTYTVTLKKTLKSVRGNELERNYTLAFATGPVIDQGSMEGKVYGTALTPAANITMLAYSMAPADTVQPNPYLRDPDYIAQTDASGNFRFDHVAEGVYRLIAINDRNGDLRFNPKNEEFAVLSTPQVKTGASALQFRLASIDTASTSLLSCEPISNTELELTFSRQLSVRSFDVSQISIEHETSKSALPVLAWYSSKRSEKDDTFRIITGTMDSKSRYRLMLNPKEMNSKPSELVFQGSGKAGINREVAVTIMPADKSTDSMIEPARPETGPAIDLQFSTPVRESSLAAAVSLTAGAGSEGKQLPFAIVKQDDRTFTVKTAQGFLPGETYRISLRKGLITDFLNNNAGDTTIVSQFKVASKEQYGSLTGYGKAYGPFAIVEARRSGTAAYYRTIATLSATGSFNFAFRELPPGNYTVSGFLPSSNTAQDPWREWQSGAPWPFSPSEPFSVSSDTVKIRARWVTENVRIEFPSPQPVPRK